MRHTTTDQSTYMWNKMDFLPRPIDHTYKRIQNDRHEWRMAFKMIHEIALSIVDLRFFFAFIIRNRNNGSMIKCNRGQPRKSEWERERVRKATTTLKWINLLICWYISYEDVEKLSRRKRALALLTWVKGLAKMSWKWCGTTFEMNRKK